MAVRRGDVGPEEVGDNNIQDYVAMLERELLNAATIVTGTTGYWASCRGCFDEDRINNATGTDGERCRWLFARRTQPDHDSRSGYAQVWREKTRKFQLFKSLTPQLFRMWVQTWQGE